MAYTTINKSKHYLYILIYIQVMGRKNANTGTGFQPDFKYTKE